MKLLKCRHTALNQSLGVTFLSPLFAQNWQDCFNPAALGSECDFTGCF